MRSISVTEQKQIQEQQKVLASVQGTRIILPMILGLAVVIYLIYRQFDYEEFKLIKWNGKVWFWLGCAVLIYALRHIFYAYRLKILSDHEFSFKHAVELVFIWEFASSISPTSIGGSAVAVFFLSQEKISAAKAVSIVLYTVIVDTLFFLISLVFLFFIFGPVLIRPEMESMLEGYGITFIIVWLFMLAYGVMLTWGLFRPRIIKRILMTIAKIPFIRKYRLKLYQIGQDVVITSKEIRNRPFSFHLQATATTIGAWVTRFLTVNFIILALVEIDWTFMSQFLLYARSQTMYVITQFSPTPGGSGVMELLFSGFFSDYISKGIGSIGALLWRLITYYPYLIIGVIIIPNWIRRVLKTKKQA
ncbi:MAG: flippase-like domain-containing protein [Saprospiraceae bacterium]|nr:flippase-like domain-containing protein [Saprospiraceae bacterium]